jgi:hypothetical protein
MLFEHTNRPYTNLIRTAVAAGESIPTFKRQLLGNGIIWRFIYASQWNIIDVCWIFATETDAFSRRNWKSPSSFQVSKTGSPTFTAGAGWQSPGATNYLNTGWNPFSNGVNFLLNDHSFFVYSTLNQEDAGVYFGAQTTISAQFGGVRFRNSDGVTHFPRYESASGEVAYPTIPSSYAGSFQVNRTSSNNGTIWKDGSSAGANFTTPSVHLPNVVLYVCCQSLIGSPVNYLVNSKIGALILGSGSVSPTVTHDALNYYLTNY